MRIQHNIMAMNAYRNYNTNTSALSKNLEKLSSGYKINRAGDDAAGLAISEKMRAQITGLNAAQKNVKDGVSLVKTAEGAMQEIQDMLNRMDYLATQSANGTYDNEVDRLNLQKEVDQLKTEINRIADSANFNGIKLLDGSLDTATGAAGTSVDVSIKMDCDMAQLHKAGASAQYASFDIDLKQALEGAVATATIAANGTFNLKVQVAGQSLTITVTASATISKGSVIDVNSLSFSAGTASTVKLTGTLAGAAATATFALSINEGVITIQQTSGSAITFDARQQVTIEASGSAKFGADYSYNCYAQNVTNGVEKKGNQLAHGHFDITAEVATALANGGTLKIGDMSITFDKDSSSVSGQVIGVMDLLDDNGKVKTDAATLEEIATRVTRAAASSSVFTVGVNGKTITLEEKYDYYDKDDKDTYLFTQEQFQNKVSCTGKAVAGKPLTLQIGDTSDSFNQLQVGIGNMHTASMKSATTGQSIADVDISNQDNAAKAIQTIKDAINYVSGVRGDLGATQNRLEHTQNNLSVMAENIQDAESTIRDTDVAEEMMSYVKNNILVQSAQAMLAQANQVPQGVLQLLG